MKVLVTGAGGFIGAQMVGLLQSEGRVGGRAIETLVGLDHRLRQGQGGVLAIEGDLAGPEVRQRIAALAPDLCFHLAAVPGGATGPDATAWWMSARRCAQNLVHAAAMAVEDREARGRAWPLLVLRRRSRRSCERSRRSMASRASGSCATRHRRRSRPSSSATPRSKTAPRARPWLPRPSRRRPGVGLTQNRRHMFKYFPTHYVWNLSVDLAIEMGARIGEIEVMCAPLQEAARQPDAAASLAFRESWERMADRLAELAREDEAGDA